MKTSLKLVVTAIALTFSAQAMAQITLYEHEGWRGRAVQSNGAIPDFYRSGLNDRASSVVVANGRWEVCDDANFRGNCMVLRSGSYESLRGMGMNDRISSARPMRGRGHYGNEAPEPLPQATYEYRRRPSESLYSARVTSVRAVVGTPEQRCWVERQQVTEPTHSNNVGGALVGALIGGVLGHQVGGGTGRDVATAGGAVAGAAIGSRANTSTGGGTYGQDVRRCESVASTTPQYWDVTYNYRGIDHRVQMAAAPGPTITVNGEGEPRM